MIAPDHSDSTAPPRVDVHCHLGQIARPMDAERPFRFEPIDDPVRHDAYMSPMMAGGLSMRLGRWFFGAPRTGDSRADDQCIEQRLLEHVLGATRLDRVVVLAFDQYHTDDGQPVGPRRSFRRKGSDLYLSNTYVRALWRQHPDRLLFGASIHPYRRAGARTAVDMLDEVASEGAVLIKWLPLHQNIDVEDPRSKAFLRRAAELRIPVLIHGGAEKTLANQHPRFASPDGLLRTLRGLRHEDAMPTVIVAHAATPAMWPVASGRDVRILTEALADEFCDAPLYADLAAMGLFNKARWLRRLLRHDAVRAKLVYGSDFPIPPTVFAFRRELGRDTRSIAGLPSLIDRDVAVKTAAGMTDAILRRGGRILRERINLADQLARSNSPAVATSHPV